VPVLNHIVGATMVEIFRMRYRPQTRVTAAWYAKLQIRTADWFARYQALGAGQKAVLESASG
ncbi:MAG: hypothetical protein WCG00_12250, partial [Hyphomicrobiales bacterium]